MIQAKQPRALNIMIQIYKKKIIINSKFMKDKSVLYLLEINEILLTILTII